MAFELKQSLTNISERWKYKMEEVSPGVFRMDVAIKMKDGAWRYQFVYVWLITVTDVFGKAHELKGHVTLIR